MTKGIRLSLVAAPMPISARPPNIDLYDCASASQMLAAMQMRLQASAVGRRPSTLAQGMIAKLAYPRARMQTPV